MENEGEGQAIENCSTDVEKIDDFPPVEEHILEERTTPRFNWREHVLPRLIVVVVERLLRNL